MSAHDDVRSANTTPDPRDLGTWARRYAQNRSLTMAVFLGVFAAVNVILGGASVLAGWAYRTGHWWLFGLCVLVAGATMITIVWLAVPRWGALFLAKLAQRLYAGEGNAQLSAPHSPVRYWLGGLVVGAFITSIAASVALETLGVFSHQYQQPISALIVVPFFVALWLLMRPAASPFALLWPGLYGLHAVLMLAGVPIRFTGYWDVLNVFFPMVGYGLLAALVSHLYSRYALRKLRRLSGGLPEEAANGEPS